MRVWGASSQKLAGATTISGGQRFLPISSAQSAQWDARGRGRGRRLPARSSASRSRSRQTLLSVFGLARFGEKRKRRFHSLCLYAREGWGGGGEYSHIFFLHRDVPTVRVSFSGSCLKRVYNFTFSCLNTVVPSNLLLFSPFNHVIFADFVRLHWNAWKRKLIHSLYCFQYDLIGLVLNRVRNYSTFS